MNVFRAYKTLTLKYYKGSIDYEVYIRGLEGLHLSHEEIREFEVILSDYARELEHKLSKVK